MEKSEYTKLPKTLDEQIELLVSRGLQIAERDRTTRQLSCVSYYRLSAYMLPFKQWQEGIRTDDFVEGTNWNQIYNLYVFDRKLRLLIFDAIEKIEIAIRTQIIYQLSHKYGSHWQDKSEIFEVATYERKDGTIVTIDVYSDIQKHIKEQLKSNKAEVFIQHYAHKYGKPENPPSWMSVEIMYFNHLSQICHNLKKRNDKVDIAKWFGLPPDVFCSWLHNINYIRNICAHHARLWNRDMNIVPSKLSFSKNGTWISNPDTVQRAKLYYFLCMVKYLLQTANPNSSFRNRLLSLLEKYKDVVNIGFMGFPANWQNEKIWM
jgi:abortive infection bacteriophage resistance protein